MYSPFFDLINKHQNWIRSFFLQGIIYIFVYSVDYMAVKGYGYNRPMFSLLLFLIGYLGSTWIIKRLKKQKLFFGFPNYGFYYNSFVAIGVWLGYLLIVRIPKFQ